MDPKIAAAFHASTKTSGVYLKFFNRLIISFLYSMIRLRRPPAQDRLEAQTHQGGDCQFWAVKGLGGEHDQDQDGQAWVGGGRACCVTVANWRSSKSRCSNPSPRPLEIWGCQTGKPSSFRGPQRWWRTQIQLRKWLTIEDLPLLLHELMASSCFVIV